MTSKTRTAPNLLAIVLISLSPFALTAQYQDKLTQDKQAIESLLASKHLDSLPGDPKTFYSRGHAVRAAALQKLIANCEKFYETQFPKRAFSVPLYVLDKNDWNERLFGAPYALPNYLPTNNLIVIGAEKNALARLSGQPDDPVTSDTIISGYDYVAVHELGHYFFITLNHVRTRKHWVDEFLANYFLICYAKGNGLDLPFSELPRNPPHKTLEDFERLYDKVGPSNYDWYQKEFIRYGLKLYPQFKVELIRKVIDNYSTIGKRVDAAALLKSLSRDTMDTWLKEMKE